jgi:hypothetical protein
MMIILPPQQGHFRASSTESTPPSLSGCCGGKVSGLPNNGRMRSMLRARTALANRL